MVTFNCEVCNETVPKKSTEKHYYRCPNAYYTCIDCNKTFDDGVSYTKHIQCITEDEKYQKSLYKGNGKKEKKKNNKITKKQETKPIEEKKKQEENKPDKSVHKLSTKLVKGQSLYKVMKSIKSKDEKKELLKCLVADEDGKFEFK
ncbi:related to UPF0743 protein YCR087C-A [Saccharomycodes ludwigii]|uniref:Related to UPF0743 protein YCR087C-A n=1 Tax=Saccharomycodes ludwigii TaxID=36035 RepID=A0A376BAQ2_9ASCO|nr:hypothetical protein SCDLUD_003766 [Saccharomycodes ludwigii]KAH3900761.1 hypothetical protein SCDLUD_003766 [Saccharomycodes ludwigii]SSD61634.1 related to UPF0743 protein YCR087C-A [Saccharomycodes ludwigii]